ncbi:MAG: hypothetical protein NVS4B6_23990 [Mycobacterium sp.]
MAGWLPHHERLASQTSPRFTGRRIDPQSRLQIGFIWRKSGVATQATRVQSDIHADRGYGLLRPSRRERGSQARVREGTSIGPPASLGDIDTDRIWPTTSS